jgi:hypothetical protein
MFQPSNRFAAPPSSGKLRVPYDDFDHAKRVFPNCDRTALRAFTQSEAARIANALIGPAKRWPASFTNVVEMFADPDGVRRMSLTQRRFDFANMLMRSGRFERRIARRLIAQGKLSAGVLA